MSIAVPDGGAKCAALLATLISIRDCMIVFGGHPQVCSSSTQVELVPGGREVAVTDANKLAYIHRVADFRLNTQLVGARQMLLDCVDL